jgi:hypothetical protein
MSGVPYAWNAPLGGRATRGISRRSRSRLGGQMPLGPTPLFELRRDLAVALRAKADSSGPSGQLARLRPAQTRPCDTSRHTSSDRPTPDIRSDAGSPRFDIRTLNRQTRFHRRCTTRASSQRRSQVRIGLPAFVGPRTRFRASRQNRRANARRGRRPHAVERPPRRRPLSRVSFGERQLRPVRLPSEAGSHMR